MKLLRRSYLKMMAAGAVVPSVFGALSGKSVSLSYDVDKKYILPPKGILPPDEIKILGAYLTDYTPPAERMAPEGGWTAVYDIIHFEGPVKIQKMLVTNTVAGQVAITRTSKNPDYQIRMKYEPAKSEEDVSASVRCNPDEICSMRDYELLWKSRTFMRREAGVVQSDALKVAVGSDMEVLDVKNPVATLWTLLDSVRLLPESFMQSRRFDLFMDLSSVYRDQQLAFARKGSVQTAAGALAIRFYQQTGRGTVPIHYAVDEQQRTLFATQGQLGWALNRIEREA